MQLKEWLSMEKGRCSAMAQELRLPASFVSNMAAGKKQIPVSHMADIERITAGAVTRAEMCPNDWRRIWPELDTAKAA